MIGRARKIIYIAGCGQSGSTVLQMLLTTTGKAVGLGELWQVVDEKAERTRKRRCSCGPRAPECEFWGPALERMASLGSGASHADRYRSVLERVEEMYGPDVAVIDSSKRVKALTTWATEVPGVDVTVLHNIRDVRPYSISALNRSRKRGVKPMLPEAIFYYWYKVNRTIHATSVKLLGRPPVQVMYESLCLATEGVAGRLAESLGENYIDPGVALNSGPTHSITGNRLRKHGRAKSLVYDYQWLMRTEWLRPYVLLPMVRKYNERCLRQAWGPPQAR